MTTTVCRPTPPAKGKPDAVVQLNDSDTMFSHTTTHGRANGPAETADGTASGVDLLDVLAQLVDAAGPPAPTLGRSGCRVAGPTAAQLRLAYQALRSTADQAGLVAHVAAEVLPYDGEWPAGVGVTGRRCAALYLAWRTGGHRAQVRDLPGRWPYMSVIDWAWAAAQLRTSRSTAARTEYLAWRLGAVLDRLERTATSEHARQLAAARALFVAWRDELATAERLRRTRRRPVRQR